MAYLDGPIGGEKDVAHLVSATVAPGEKKHGLFDDRMLFIDTLAYAIHLKENDKPLLLEALQKKWPEAVESSMKEATRLAQETASPAVA